MARNIRITEPSEEVKRKILKAREGIADKKSRAFRCPYCKQSSVMIYGSGDVYVQIKCKRCGVETPFSVIDMRRIRKS